MSRRAQITLCAVFAVVGAVHAYVAYGATAAAVASPYLYNFNAVGTLQEIGSMLESGSSYWWVNSGAYLKMYGSTGHTNQGALPLLDPWRILYAASNPVDTDNGAHPQNIFRLLTTSKWQNSQEQASFLINNVNMSTSPNRNESNGLLLFSRYQDHNDLYYAGIRTDGAAVIKKKQNGIYYTLLYVPKIYPGTYNVTSKPNLIPIHQWIGLRLDTQTLANGTVRVTLSLDKNNSGNWVKVAQAIDAGGSDNMPITQTGYGGIRTDFMDVSFEDFKLTNL